MSSVPVSGTSVVVARSFAGPPPRTLWRRFAGPQNNNIWFWVFVGPFVLGLAVFVVAPIVWSIVLSLYEARNTVSPTKFVGLRNYADMLRDGAFRSSLLTFVAFAAFIVPVTFAGALGLALMVNRVGVGKGFFRSVFFVPVACSYVVASTIWKLSIFNGVRFGLANTLLRAFGFEGRQWLSRPHPPLYWVVIVSERMWLQVGFYMLLFLAGLQRIPKDLYEAASVDGATRGWQTFRHITFPQLRATSAAVLVLLLINAFQAFDEFFNLLVEPGRRHLPALRPAAARLPVLPGAGAGAGLRPRQRRRGDPHAAHRRVHAGAGPPARLREAGQLWLRCDPTRPARRGRRGRALRRADLRRRAVPDPLLPRRAQRAVDRPRALLAALEAVPDHAALRQHRRPVRQQHRAVRPRLRTSAVVSIVQTTGAVLIASMAGYGLARVPYRFANTVFYGILATLMIPAAVTFVPSFIIISEIGWLNSYKGLIVPGMFAAFAAFLFRQYFIGFPIELEEAARIDGLSTWGTYWRIVVPNSKGIFAAVASITFIASWNAFLWPLVVGRGPRQVDGAGGAVVVPRLAGPEDEPVVHRLGDRHPAARHRVRPAAALDRRGRRAHRHQRLIAQPIAQPMGENRTVRSRFRPSVVGGIVVSRA